MGGTTLVGRLFCLHDLNGLNAQTCVQLSRDCKVEVQRILHQRALDVKLDPELQKRCMTDLGKWCSEKTDAGQVRQNNIRHRVVSLADCRAARFLSSFIHFLVFAGAGVSAGTSRGPGVCLQGRGRKPNGAGVRGQRPSVASQSEEEDRNKSPPNICVFTVQDIQIDALLIRACEPVIQAHCHVRT